MKKIALDNKLNKEKKKLCKLVILAKNNGVPICQDRAVMEQNVKVDSLIINVQQQISANNS